MAAGELLVDPNLFSGFLHRPSLWAGVFLESATWTMPVILIGLFILGRLRFLNRSHFLTATFFVWFGLGAVIVVLYKFFYWPRTWHLTRIEPGIIFGWGVPCAFILIAYSILSVRFFRPNDSNL